MILKRLITLFTITFGTLVFITIAYFGVMSLITGASLTDILRAGTVFDVKTITIGSYTTDFYLFNIKNYTNNLKQGITYGWNYLLPLTPNTIPAGKWYDIIAGLKTIGNGIFWLINWIIYILNMLLVPIKLLIYPITIVLTILSIDITRDNGNGTWLEVIAFLYQINIPYINYLT